MTDQGGDQKAKSSADAAKSSAEVSASSASSGQTASDAPVDEATKLTVQKIPMLKTKAGPRDGEAWVARQKEELLALIKYVQMNKQADSDWFLIEGNKTGTKWTGKCWYIHNLAKYEFELNFEIPVSYPTTPFEIVLPELDGKTAKMYRGGKICLSAHFKPLWARNVPRFGVAHALALGLAPWLAAEVPHLAEAGLIAPAADKNKPASSSAVGSAAGSNAAGSSA